MTRTLRSLLTLSLVCLYALTLSGCGDKTATTSATAEPTAGEHAGEDHDHHDDHDGHDHDDDHDGHDHPEHGPRGGHLLELSDGTKVEVMLADDLDLFTVWAEDPENVKKVEMITKIGDTEKTYSFDKTSTDDAASFELTAPELATAAKMGEGVDIDLIITYEDRELTGNFEHHAH